jgi:hypothetical protein
MIKNNNYNRHGFCRIFNYEHHHPEGNSPASRLSQDGAGQVEQFFLKEILNLVGQSLYGDEIPMIWYRYPVMFYRIKML